MIETLRAFSYLTWHTLRNRTWTRIRRARNPRYAISAIIGAAYFWFFLIHNPGQVPRAIGSSFNDMWVVVSTLGLVIFATSWWLFGGDKTTLAFSLAETSFLFPAPLSRRAIIGYKLFRSQLTILINAAIFIFLMRRGIGYLPSGYRAISLWTLFTTLNFHRVAAALVRTSWIEHKRHAFRRNLVPTLVVATMIIGVLVAAFDGWAAVVAVQRSQGIFEAVGAARRVIDSAPASYVLWPVRALVAPVFALTVAEWVAALPAAFLVLMLHVWWVLRTDAAFEESAIAASYERVRRIEAFKARRLTAPRPEEISRTGIALPVKGHPAIAIVWKNLLCLRRTFQLRVLIAPLLMATVWGWAFAGRRGLVAAIAIGCATLAGLLTFFGPMLVRNDLRQDMQNLTALKTIPLSGRTVVMAEVMSSALPIAAAQFLIVVIGGICATLMDSPLPVTLVATIIAASLPALLAFATVMVAVQNGAPVLFPGWVRLGTVVGGGMENLGQGVMSMGIILILVMLLMIPAAGVAAFSIWFIKPFSLAAGLFAGLVTGSVTLAAEAFGIFSVLGRALEKTEPSDAAYAS
ncbi:MAG TPA: putative ABC exporter domain-containing protein [Gemmatimonadaceae bacterium]|nr:putative ABC exporter domain-containing protein [Gemmatimonadaceae bacterium]